MDKHTKSAGDQIIVFPTVAGPNVFPRLQHRAAAQMITVTIPAGETWFKCFAEGNSGDRSPCGEQTYGPQNWVAFYFQFYFMSQGLILLKLIDLSFFFCYIKSTFKSWSLFHFQMALTVCVILLWIVFLSQIISVLESIKCLNYYIFQTIVN